MNDVGHQSRAGQRARTVRIVAFLAVIVAAFGVVRRVTGAEMLTNLTDVEILGILVGLGGGTLIALWWMRRH